uniref:Uncharacterized protein n=1 Tax=Romanomermis culicivorax TaxID=13658 RepID=A0A915HVP3_ROMCU
MTPKMVDKAPWNTGQPSRYSPLSRRAYGANVGVGNVSRKVNRETNCHNQRNHRNAVQIDRPQRHEAVDADISDTLIQAKKFSHQAKQIIRQLKHSLRLIIKTEVKLGGLLTTIWACIPSAQKSSII